ncbi:21712_t:CDS:1 [Gigaspora margarita]|uniref:tryptophan--tRNA ligase n=1 Tax=Gigaspora margarita TaxID=4874 RepID=A0ABM8VVG8_GIGMA|nr:21712_t:CDS:1 [Gigaspora margarita]
MSKPRLFTGIQPTGSLTLGHYCGVIHHIISLQNDYEVIIMLADLHALTLPNPHLNYQEKCYEMAALLYACGLREENCKIFCQSQVPEHLILSHLLSPFVTVGSLSHMIQYKEKKRGEETGNLALLSYPVLMAADIFLYDADLVIVGQDQRQHLELTNTIARKFNNFFGQNLLKIPQFSIPDRGAKIMDLQNPTRKMSKSEPDHLSLLDAPEIVKKKVVRAITDSENKIRYQPKKKPGISNLLTIYSLLADREIKEVERNLTDLNYHQFKLKLAELINDKLTIIQKNYGFWRVRVEELLRKNSNHLRLQAEKKIALLKEELAISSLPLTQDKEKN